MKNRITALTLAALATPALAGPLMPPVGPVASTMKTLDQVEPRLLIGGTYTPGDADALFKINSPGSYYLGGSYSVQSGRMFLEINASNVVVDLSGFRIAGTTGSLDGIRVNMGNTNVTVRNGAISGFGQTGINADGANAVTLEDLYVSATGDGGVRVGGGSSLSRVTVDGATSYGFVTYAGTLVRDCIARGCLGMGFDAFGPTSFEGCTAYNNHAEGFYATSGSSINRCTASGNWGYAIRAIINADALSVTDNTVIVPNTTGAGGVSVQFNSTVRGNTIRSSNGATADILLVGSGNRVEANTTSGGSQAVATSSTKNLIVSNFHTGASSGAFTVGAGNTVGPVISSTGTISSTNPWANFWLP